MLSGLQRVMAARDAVIVSSTLFMIIHLSPLSFPHLLLIGLVLGWMRVRSGSLYPGMVLHFVHNGLVLVAEQHPGLVPWS
jgi:membrane protease YdiL (CAAX protease family)